MTSEVKEIPEVTKTTSITLKKLPATIHNKAKKHQMYLIGRDGRMVTLEDAYIDLLREATERID